MASSSSMRRMSSQANRSGRSVARVLRYPDGRVRRILYPDVKQNTMLSSSSSPSSSTTTTRHKTKMKKKKDSNVMQTTKTVPQKETDEEQERRRWRNRAARRTDEGVPDTAEALLALLRSPEARRKRVEEEEALRSVFDVCDTMPERLTDARVAVLADADIGDVLCYEVRTDDDRRYAPQDCISDTFGISSLAHNCARKRLVEFLHLHA